MSTSYTVGVQIEGNAASYLRATQQAQQATRTVGAAAKAEFDKLKGFMASYQGRLASLGLGAGFVAMARDAAKLERTITQVSLTSGVSLAEHEEAYNKMFDMVKRNGGVMEDTVAGFNGMVQAGLKYQAAKAGKR